MIKIIGEQILIETRYGDIIHKLSNKWIVKQTFNWEFDYMAKDFEVEYSKDFNDLIIFGFEESRDFTPEEEAILKECIKEDRELYQAVIASSNASFVKEDCLLYHSNINAYYGVSEKDFH